MFARTAWAEVVNHQLECPKRRGAVGRDVSTVGFLLARCEHLHRRFVSVDHALSKHCFAQRIDQGLELHAGLADPFASVERAMAKPARPKIFSCRYSGKWSANLATIT